MATRRRNPKVMGEYSWILHTGDVATQGEAAGLDTATGDMRPMGTSSTQFFVGFFAETLTGDGTKKVRVTLPTEVEAEWLANDSNPNNITASTIGSEVYAKDGKTVSTLATGRSKAGRVLDYDSVGNLVLVQGGLAVTGPSGSTGVAGGTVATRSALAAVAVADRFDGQVVVVLSDNSVWRFNAAASFTSDENQQLGVTPGAGTGRWVRTGLTYVKVPIAFGTADAAALLTVPTGFVLRLTGLPYWEVTADFTGGASSAIGVSATAIATTKGDLLGGAAGDVAASLTAGTFRPGTIGPKIDTPAEVQAFALKAADVLRFDRITSAFTAGTGFVIVPAAAVYTG